MKAVWFIMVNIVRIFQNKNPYLIPSIIMVVTMVYFIVIVHFVYISHKLQYIAIEWIFLMLMVGYLRFILSGVFRNGIVMLYMLIAEVTYTFLFILFYFYP